MRLTVVIDKESVVLSCDLCGIGVETCLWVTLTSLYSDRHLCHMSPHFSFTSILLNLRKQFALRFWANDVVSFREGWSTLAQMSSFRRLLAYCPAASGSRTGGAAVISWWL